MLETYKSDTVSKVVYWDEVEGAGLEHYDESFLATLRDELKKAERDGVEVYIVPRRFSGKGAFWDTVDSNKDNVTRQAELFGHFTTCMVHTARRIKDCKNVRGFVLPNFKEDWTLLCVTDIHIYEEQFIAAFQKKHSQYAFVQQ